MRDFIILPVLILLGWLVGSLINYLADMLPVIRRLGPVRCAGCGEGDYSMLSYLLMRNCSACGGRRAIRAWAVQVLAVIMILAEWFFPSERLGFSLGALLLAYFGLVAVVDIEHRLILYVESIAGAVIGLAVGTWLHGLQKTLLGGLGGLGMLAGLYLLGWLLAKGMGRLRGQPIEEDALGFGDIMLGTVMGLLLGWPGVIAGVVYTIFIAGAGSLLILLIQMLRRKYQPFAAVAFGPYMLLAAILLLFGAR